jgi:flagellar motor switch protein FliN/FliY
MDVTMNFSIELGRTMMPIKDINSLNEGTIVELDKNHGDPVDVLVNGKIIAHGKIVVVDEYYGVEITGFVKSMAELLKEM